MRGLAVNHLKFFFNANFDLVSCLHCFHFSSSGGSPWEVPWGEIIGEESFKTLSKIHTGYGEKGPSQGRLRKEGSSKEIERDFPLLDYILDCNIIDTLS